MSWPSTKYQVLGTKSQNRLTRDPVGKTKSLVLDPGPPNLTAMIGSCARCGTPAASIMSYDYGERAIWLDDIQEGMPPGAGYLMCGQHSDRMTPPLGWTLTDRRTAARLFAPLEVA